MLVEQNDIGHSLFKFYNSVPLLKSEEDFLYHHQPFNLTFLTYLKSDEKESDRKAKMMRRLYTSNEFTHLKFCIVRSKKLAQILHIDTKKEGEIYMFSNYKLSKQMTEFDLMKITFYCTKVADEKQCLNRDDNRYYEEMLNYPIVLNNFVDFFNFNSRYKVC
jgi:hypothetical protein